jgi:hypothetical protein
MWEPGFPFELLTEAFSDADRARIPGCDQADERRSIQRRERIVHVLIERRWRQPPDLAERGSGKQVDANRRILRVSRVGEAYLRGANLRETLQRMLRDGGT